MILLSMLLAFGAQDIDAEACETLTRVATQTKPSLPRMVDAVTSLEEVHADCEAKTYVMNKRGTVAIGTLAEGWEERQQETLDAIVCDSPLREFEQAGWRFIQVLRFPGGEEVVTTVKCD